MSEIKVNVRWNQKVYPIDTHTHDTIQKFKQLVSIYLNVPIERQKYLGNLAKKFKNDMETLQSAGIRDGSTILMVGSTKDETKNLEGTEEKSEETSSNESMEYEFIESQYEDQQNNQQTNEQTVEKVESVDLRQVLETQTNSKNHPYFFDKDFDSAFDTSKRECKILMSIVYSAKDSSSVKFCKEVLTNDAIIEVVKHNFVLWCCDIANTSQMMTLQRMLARSGHVGEKLSPTLLPFTSLCCYHDNSISVLDIIEGPISMENLMIKLLNVVEIYGPLLENQKAGKFKKESETQKLLKEQEKQFQEALKRDRERQEQIRIEEEKKKQEEIKRKLEEERKKQEIEEKKKTLPSEPSETEKDTTRVLLRLPDGSRVQRRFRLSEKIGTIFDFLLVEKHLQSDQYDLVSNFPKITYCMEKHKDVTLKDAKLYPQAALFVKEKN